VDGDGRLRSLGRGEDNIEVKDEEYLLLQDTMKQNCHETERFSLAAAEEGLLWRGKIPGGRRV